ncbi:MAG: AsmA family protein [Candidatus Sulfotelmatobacter sp.]
MKFSSSKRRWIVAAVILLLLFLIRPGASHLKSRIASSIGSAVGRAVEIGSVHLRLLPRPGFDLENLVVYDDPAFGAEPMLRASEVTADLRLTSLVRGRLEIARLDLNEPSLNVVHGENGRWNLETLLERAARTPLAPTAKAKTEPRPGFPYIEATSARINFKNGQEKKPYALTNADFSLWQDSENAWGVRLQAQPVRTDLNLNDTGVLRVNGNWQRAAALRDTPLQFTLEWSRAQLGQLTKLFTGSDLGWRGGLQLDATFVGTPAKLAITSDASIQDFRRYDITSGQPVRLAAHCDGQYSSLDHGFHDLACRAPVGSGLITLKGDAGLPGSRDYGLDLAAENIPAGAMVAMAELAKKSLPADLTADGTLRGSLSIHEGAGSKFRFEGKGEISQFRLASATNKSEVGPETVPFVLTNGNSASRAQRQAARKSVPNLQMPEDPHLEFGPFSLSAGRAPGATVRAWANRGGYDILIAGETDIASALRVARVFGIPASQAAAEGTAQVDLQIAGSWAKWGQGTASGFPGPQVTGTAKLHNVRFGIRGAAGPVEILSADMQLASDQVRIAKLSAKTAGASWTGSLEMPRGCGAPGACEVHFSLNANQIATSALREWISPRAKERPWYRVLQSNPQTAPSFLAALRAAGHLTVDRLQVSNLTATHVAANLSLDGGKLKIQDLNGDVLGGTQHGAWQADFSVRPALFSGRGSLSGIVLAQLADTMKDAPLTGTLSGDYQITGTGTSGTEFWHSAEGTLQLEVREGALAHVSLIEDEGPLKITRLSGQARLQSGKLEMKDAKLDSPSGRFQLSGTASLKRELNLKLSRTLSGTPTGYSITGTLAAPHVVPLPGTEQARLKP